MKVLEVFYQPRTLDCYTFVLDGDNEELWPMLGTDKTGAGFSQFCDGEYHPGGDNSHLGKQVEWDKVPEILRKHVERRVNE